MKAYFRLICILLLVIVTQMALCSKVSHFRSRLPRNSFISARFANAQAVDLPTEWSWQNIKDKNVKEYAKAFGKGLKLGSYTSPVINQHRSQWCGCCYMISALQVLQDRTHIIMGSQGTFLGSMMPWIEFDSQIALDTYDTYHRPALQQPWNACRGGDPLKVFQAIEQDVVPLIIVNGIGSVWLGYPNVDRKKYKVDHNLKVVNSRHIKDQNPDLIKREIFEKGPLVLGINAQYIKETDVWGYLPLEGTVGPRNHAVSVVGWKKNKNVEYWIIRNSWGKSTVPEDKPTDVKCVTIGENLCKVNMDAYISDPGNLGYIYAPIHHPHFVELKPSPWYTADVIVKD